MEEYILTKRQARRFILLKQGLLGRYTYIGKDGICAFVNQAGCIQFDPIDVCGKNAELVLQSRIKGFSKQMLYDLLYKDRKLIDYFDKNLAIMDIHDWKYFGRIREGYRNSGRGREEVDAVVNQIKDMIRQRGPVCSKDFDLGKRIDWYWSNNTKLSRVALETMYYRGDLIIHHKKGAVKYYALAEDYIPNEILKAEDPCKEELEHMKWRVLRRISAVGLLWNRPSDAWLNIADMKSEERNQIFHQLLQEKKILEISVENMNEKLYCLASDVILIEDVISESDFTGRTEFLAPLDCMLWDRKLIKAIFDFEYKWEIYTPQKERLFGYYILPILSEERFIGRAEIINDRKKKCLVVENIWLEVGVKQTKKLTENLERCIKRFATFNDCKDFSYNYTTK